ALEGIGGFNTADFGDHAHVQQCGHARREVFAGGGGGGQDVAVVLAHFCDQVGHVFGQLVAVGGVVGQQDLAHAFYLGSFVGDSGTAFTGNQHGDVTADGLGGSNDVQGDPFQSGIVMFCVD